MCDIFTKTLKIFFKCDVTFETHSTTSNYSHNFEVSVCAQKFEILSKVPYLNESMESMQ